MFELSRKDLEWRLANSVRGPWPQTMTTGDHFHRLEALYNRLAPLAAEERARVLTELRASEPALCSDLERLLQRDGGPEKGSGLLELFPTDEEPREGDKLGAYRLLRRIGEGGMGVVYEAQQEGPVSRRVAVKLVRRGFFGNQAAARFAREIELLALMNHPGIAQVYDAGTTRGGRPYVAMELIDGEPVTDYCDRLALSPRGRLELFIDICRAVQSAHQKGILHRDLKPSNILVTEDEGMTRPKLIDFGIARPVDESKQEQALTRAGDVLGTPEYMSPEQTRAGAVDTRSDIYALGVVLYQLLTGSLPLSATSAAGPTAADEVRRRIREEDPEFPSTRVRKCASAVAREQRGRLRILARGLRGDLDWITMKALAKTPDDRYDSAAAFADDIVAHLQDEPVAAGAPSRRYRLAKFVRRHTFGVAAGAVVLLSLVVTATTSTFLLLRAEEARREAETQRRTAEEVSAFLQRSLAEADPVAAQSKEQMTVRSMLDEAAWQIDASLGDEPRVNAVLQLTVGDAYQNLGLFERARESFTRALELRWGVEPRTDEVEALLRLAELDRIAGKLDPARERASAASRVASTQGEAEGGWLGRSQQVLGLVEIDRGDYAEGERLLRLALESARAQGAPGLEASLLSDLGLLLKDRGRLDEAIPLLEQAIAAQRAVVGDQHSATAEALGDLAWVLIASGDQQRAIRLLQESLAILERVFPDHHPTLAVARATLAGALREVGRVDEAVPLLERTLEDFRVSLGPEHAYVAHSLNNLALAFEQADRIEPAVDLYRQAADHYDRLYAEDHPQVAIARYNLARALRRAGALVSAEKECLESLRIRRRVLREGHPDTARNLSLLAQLRRDEGKLHRAESLLEEALAIRRAGLPEGHSLTAATLLLLGETELELGQLAASHEHLEEARELFSVLAADNPDPHQVNRERSEQLLATLQAGR